MNFAINKKAKCLSTSPFRKTCYELQLAGQTTADNAGGRYQAGAQHDQAGRLRNGSDHAAGEDVVRTFVVRIGEVRAEERAVEELVAALLAANAVQTIGVAVERTAEAACANRNYGFPVLGAGGQGNIQTIDFVAILGVTEIATAGRGVGNRAGSRSNQRAAVAFRDASADFPVARGRGQLAQVVGEQPGSSCIGAESEVLIGGRTIRGATDDCVVLVRQTVLVWIIQVEIAAVEQAIATALGGRICCQEQRKQGQQS